MKLEHLFEQSMKPKTGVYVSVKPTAKTKTTIARLITDLGIGAEETVNLGECHVTLMYDKIHDIPHTLARQEGTIRHKGRYRLDLFGPEKDALVLVLEDSEEFQKRHAHLVAAGLTPTYPDYKPHITLSYNYSGKIPELPVWIYDEQMTFNNETIEPAVSDWAEKKGMK